MNESSRLRNFVRDPLNLLAAGFLLVWGIVAVTCRPIGDFGVETDFYGDLARYAREWADGRPSLMNGFRGPLYYIVLAGADLLHLDLFLAAKLISVVSATIALRVAGGLLRRLFGGPAGLAAAMVIAAGPVTVEYSYRACTDLFFFALFTGALALIFRQEKPVIRDWAIAGGLASGAYLTRHNGLFFLPVAVVVGFVRFGFSRAAFLAIATFAGCFAIAALPWWIFVWSRTGDPMWSNSYQNVAITILAGNPNLAQSGNFMGSNGLTSVKDIWDVSPLLFLQGMTRNIGEHLWRDVKELSGPIWAGAALIGIVLNWRAWLRRDTIAFAAAGVITFISLLAVFYNPRFMMTLILWWAAAAGGIAAWSTPASTPATKSPERVLAAGSKKDRKRLDRKPSAKGSPSFRPLPAILAAFLLAGLYLTWRGIEFSRDEVGEHVMPTEILELVREVKRQRIEFNENTPISARKPHIGYYLGAPVVPIILGTTSNMREAGVHYLLVSGIEALIYPSLRPMWFPRKPEDIGSGFRLLATGRFLQPDQRERRATLYAINDPIPWTPTPSDPVHVEEPPPPGLSRVDFLRLKLARWYFRWDAEIRPESMLRLMKPATLDHIDVLPIRADVAVLARRYDEAENLYRRILESRPGDERAIFCLAGLALLRNDNRQFDALIRLSLEGNEPGSVEPRHFYDRAQIYIREMDYLPAFAPVSLTLQHIPDSQWGLMALAYIQQAQHRFPEAITTLNTYLEQYPEDPEATALLEGILKEENVSD